MKRHPFYIKIITLLLMLGIVCSASCLTAFADDPPAEGENIVDSAPEQAAETPQEEIPQEQAQPETPQEELPQEQAQPEIAQEEPQQNEWYDYIYSYDEDAQSYYEEPEHLGELPEVSPTQVVEATAVAMPTVAVSDASLFSGIVMWLCVALGIAVVVGVLVSKRTRRRGA